MRRGIVAGAAGVAVAVAACAGCSGNKSSTGASSPSSTPPATDTRIIVDGQNQNVTGEVSCVSANWVTTIGIGDATAGLGAVVSDDNPPIVHSVGLGSVDGVALGFSDAAPNEAGNAAATVDGKSYAIKGTATGTDMSNPSRPQHVAKSFEMDVTCP